MTWNILGHDWAVNLLKEHVAGGNVRHAYLLTGAQGIGRRTLALRLAQALNCPQSPAPGEPCMTCQTCTRIERMQYSDLSIVQAESRGGMLKVDQIRELQHSLSLAPYEGRYRVAILLRFEEANPNASNALLKTLEEPPGQVVLILTAESPESLFPTIVSRCEVLRLRPLPIETLSLGLQSRWGVPASEANLLAHLSGGRLGYALDLHHNPQRLEQRSRWLGDHYRLLKASMIERFAYAESLSKDRDLLRDVIQVWLSLWRDIMLHSAGSQAPLANLDQAEQIEALAKHSNPESSRLVADNLLHTLELLERHVNARLAAEALLLDLPRLQDKNGLERS
jgi:DNA polymerase-3 subunit delta'